MVGIFSMKFHSTKSSNGKYPQQLAVCSGYSADGSFPKCISTCCLPVTKQYENCLQSYYCFFNISFSISFSAIVSSLHWFPGFIFSPDEVRSLHFIYNLHTSPTALFCLLYHLLGTICLCRNWKNGKMQLLEPSVRRSYLCPLRKEAGTTPVARKKRSKGL